MSPSLQQDLKQKKPFRSLQQEAYLSVVRTSTALTDAMEDLVKGQGISATQYNVLRILRGSPEGLTCGEIASRMITRDPDITRLLDRLEKRGLISRWREARDRRVVMAKITADGLKVLARLDESVEETHRKQLGHMGKEKLRALAALLNDARSQV